MRKRFMIMRATNWQLLFLYQVRRFHNRLCGTFFKRYLHKNEALDTRIFIRK